MTTIKDALNAIESHEKECAAIYKSIDKRLEDGSKRFDKLDNMIWAVYPFTCCLLIASLPRLAMFACSRLP